MHYSAQLAKFEQAQASSKYLSQSDSSSRDVLMISYKALVVHSVSG